MFTSGFYKQTNGCAMGKPFSVILIYMHIYIYIYIYIYTDEAKPKIFLTQRWFIVMK